MKLILFSGGVESTALLTQASKEDIALVINPVYATDMVTYRKHTMEQIAKAYGLSIVYVNFQLPEFKNSAFVHQMSTFVSVCNLMVQKNPQITEVWCGRNILEPHKDIQDYIEKNMLAWSILNPNIPFKHPLDHLSKKQQWDLISQNIQPLVSSCIHHTFCGRCYKCKEWLCLSESLPKITNNQIIQETSIAGQVK